MGAAVPAIPGIKADGDLLQSFRREVAGLLGRDKLSFPGAQPVSFGTRHISELQKQDYFLCEKSDGIRCLMYFTHDGPEEVIYLIDRKNDYYHVAGLHFPTQESEQEFHTETLVDGELVNDTLPNGTTELRYLVFDCMVLGGKDLRDRTLDKRLAYFRDKIFQPYTALYKKYPEEIQYLPFIVEFKKMQFSYAIEMMFKDVLPNLPHGSDGLIFTCVNTPYQSGTDQHILKWKPEDENSIDFRTQLEWPMVDPDSEDERDGITSPYPDYEAMPKLNLMVKFDNKDERIYGTMFMEDREWEELKALAQPLDDRVVECHQDEQGRWRFMRFRNDKQDANHISTVRGVIESIEDKVSKEDLVRAAKRIRDEWKKRQAADLARQKEDEDARKRLYAQSSTNGHQDPTRISSTGEKRKAEENENLTNGRDNAKRRLTPQPGSEAQP